MLIRVVAIQLLAVSWPFLPSLAGVSPTYGFLGIVQTACVDFGGCVFCHPGYSARKIDVQCSSATVSRDIFKGDLH